MAGKMKWSKAKHAGLYAREARAYPTGPADWRIPGVPSQETKDRRERERARLQFDIECVETAAQFLQLAISWDEPGPTPTFKPLRQLPADALDGSGCALLAYIRYTGVYHHCLGYQVGSYGGLKLLTWHPPMLGCEAELLVKAFSAREYLRHQAEFIPCDSTTSAADHFLRLAAGWIREALTEDDGSQADEADEDCIRALTVLQKIGIQRQEYARLHP